MRGARLMHDPMVVAWEIRNPFPRRVKWRERHYKGRRWGFTRRRMNSGEPQCRWFKPRAWELALGGRVYGMRHFITIWHVEPDGHDSGSICHHQYRWQDEVGKWHSKPLRGWRWHVHHWQVQVVPLQALHRWLFQRCTWCGGPSRKKNPVNVSHSWDGPRGKHWWQGSPGLFHSGCLSAHNVAGSCLCDVPMPDGWNGFYGTCATCGKYYRGEASWVAYRKAIELAGEPKPGQSWKWPKEVDFQEIQKEVEARQR